MKRSEAMRPVDIRDELLSQHQGLRDLVGDARDTAERWARGEASRDAMRGELMALADALRRHHLSEEHALGDLLRSIELRAPPGESFMDEDHYADHGELLDALARVRRLDDPREGGFALEKICADLLEHMTWEEKALLEHIVMGELPPERAR